MEVAMKTSSREEVAIGMASLMRMLKTEGMSHPKDLGFEIARSKSLAVNPRFSVHVRDKAALDAENLIWLKKMFDRRRALPKERGKGYFQQK